MEEYPDVDLTQFVLDGDDDILWNPHTRESIVDKSDRVYDFLTRFIMDRPESEIAVVGHSAWLFNMCNTVVDCCGDGDDDDDDDGDFLRTWFQTAEIRSMRLTFMSRKERE